MKATTRTILWVRVTIFTVVVVGWIGEVAAAPQIIAQPRNLAVDLGEAAAFSVYVDTGAVGRGKPTTPCQYQWQVNGIDIFGATAATFRITEVKRLDLGWYTVIVTDATGEVTSRPAVSKIARWTEVAYFGSSEGMAQYHNGPSWIDVLAETLGIGPALPQLCGGRRRQCRRGITRLVAI